MDQGLSVVAPEPVVVVQDFHRDEAIPPVGGYPGCSWCHAVAALRVLDPEVFFLV